MLQLQDSDNEDDLAELEEAIVNERTLSGLRWIAKRTSVATKSLLLDFKWYGEYADSTALVAAFSDVAHLSNLRCLLFWPYPRKDKEIDPALVKLLGWLLQHALRVEAMDICIRTQCLPANGISFQHLRHLMIMMTSDNFRSPWLVAKQLPVLETLYIDGGHDEDSSDKDSSLEDCSIEDYYSLEELGVLDLSGCKRLRRLVLCDAVAQELIWDNSAGSRPCPLALELPAFQELYDAPSRPFITQKALAQQLVLNGFGCADSKLHAAPQLRFLALRWLEDDSDSDDDEDEGETDEEPASFASCMPDDEQALLNLETLIITDCTELRGFPRSQQLPNLRELVIQGSGRLEVGFQDPVDTISGLDSLYLFGQPLCISKEDMVKLFAASYALEQRGLVLDSAHESQRDEPDEVCSCIYLRRLGARALSFEEISAQVDQLVQCRCGACYDCLQRAGCMEV